MNIVIIKGNLTRDPELRYTPSGMAVCGCSVAVNEVWYDKDQQKQERVNFFDVDFWDKAAENVSKFFTKGKPILVTGRLKHETWDDKTTGEKRSKVKITGDRFEFCGDTKGASEAGGRPQPGRSPQRASRAEAAQPDAPDAGGHQADADDNVPF